MAHAVQQATSVGARHFTELAAWQLATELRDRVTGLTSRRTFQPERSLRDDLNRAAESVPNNVAEGFGRFSPRDFRRFLETARSWLNEVQNRLLEARRKRLVTEDEFAPVWQLSRRSAAAIAKLMRYLLTERAQQAADRARRIMKEEGNAEPSNPEPSNPRTLA